MGFTKICFIRKTTPKITVELDKLGYRMGFMYSKEQTQIDSILCIQGEFRFAQNSLIDIIKKDIPYFGSNVDALIKAKMDFNQIRND